MFHPSSDIAFTPSVKACRNARDPAPPTAASRSAAAGAPRSRRTSQPFSPSATAPTSRPPAPTASPTSSTAAGRRASSACIDEETLAFADFSGNRQYITTGNLAENERAYLFLMDYAHRRRVKIWGRARVVEDAETDREADAGGLSRHGPSRRSCSPSRPGTPTAPSTSRRSSTPPTSPRPCNKLQARIAELEAENEELRRWIGPGRAPAGASGHGGDARRSPRRRADEGRPTKVFDASVTAW